MTKKQEEPAPLPTIERKTTLRLRHELVEKILREALKIPPDAYFSVGDYGTTIDCEFVWKSEEPLADLTQLDAIKGAPVLTDAQWTPEELAAMRAPGNVEPVQHSRLRGLKP